MAVKRTIVTSSGSYYDNPSTSADGSRGGRGGRNPRHGRRGTKGKTSTPNNQSTAHLTGANDIRKSKRQSTAYLTGANNARGVRQVMNPNLPNPFYKDSSPFIRGGIRVPTSDYRPTRYPTAPKLYDSQFRNLLTADLIGGGFVTLNDLPTVTSGGNSGGGGGSGGSGGGGGGGWGGSGGGGGGGGRATGGTKAYSGNNYNVFESVMSWRIATG